MSTTCPGCLVTVSADESVKVWDIMNGKPKSVEQHNPGLGALQCLSACPDAPFVFCAGGDKKDDNFKVWDIRQSINGKL